MAVSLREGRVIPIHSGRVGDGKVAIQHAESRTRYRRLNQDESGQRGKGKAASSAQDPEHIGTS
jgi:hypothetical protein